MSPTVLAERLALCCCSLPGCRPPPVPLPFPPSTLPRSLAAPKVWSVFFWVSLSEWYLLRPKILRSGSVSIGVGVLVGMSARPEDCPRPSTVSADRSQGSPALGSLVRPLPLRCSLGGGACPSPCPFSEDRRAHPSKDTTSASGPSLHKASAGCRTTSFLFPSPYLSPKLLFPYLYWVRFILPPGYAPSPQDVCTWAI